MCSCTGFEASNAFAARGIDPTASHPRFEVSEARHDEKDTIPLAITEHDRLLDEVIGLQQVLDRLRRNVLAASGNNDVLDAIRDREEFIIIDFPDIAGVEPTLRVDGLRRRFRQFVIALHHLGSTDQNLAIVSDSDFGAGDRPPDRADPEALQRIEVRDRAGLGESVALEDLDPR